MKPGCRVLIVDDDRDFSESIAAYLRTHGFEVDQAYDGAHGLKTARLQRPDLILMDIMMGERTEGFFTVQQIRRDPQLGATPIFVVTSLYRDLPGFRVEPDPGWLAHDEFMPKPVDLDRLLDRIEARLGSVSQPASQNSEDDE